MSRPKDHRDVCCFKLTSTSRSEHARLHATFDIAFARILERAGPEDSEVVMREYTNQITGEKSQMVMRIEKFSVDDEGNHRLIIGRGDPNWSKQAMLEKTGDVDFGDDDDRVPYVSTHVMVRKRGSRLAHCTLEKCPGITAVDIRKYFNKLILKFIEEDPLPTAPNPKHKNKLEEYKPHFLHEMVYNTSAAAFYANRQFTGVVLKNITHVDGGEDMNPDVEFTNSQMRLDITKPLPAKDRDTLRDALLPWVFKHKPETIAVEVENIDGTNKRQLEMFRFEKGALVDIDLEVDPCELLYYTRRVAPHGGFDSSTAHQDFHPALINVMRGLIDTIDIWMSSIVDANNASTDEDEVTGKAAGLSR